MIINTYICFTDGDYDKTESTIEFVRVLVNSMIGEVFKVRKLPNVFCLYMCFCFVFIGDLFIMLLVFLS